ncbi:hypothetical protein LZZ85_24630 [Terrimonas sp. NA20]|uniref:Uncharacterized protein n=1 Tax=Terrimonas ginsenosidimutans TaxID=2908004 RepID=A0ABS9KYW8_9BACT|nr:hypothetical protein [Terrimonas ginsenosidimutans]MCG2617508.1 hypothetical protein [Terrimonas ginsenosidimutans]
MYQKITTTHDINILRSGTQLIQYPLGGLSTDELDLSEPDKHLLYEVCAVEADNIKIKPANSSVDCDPVPAVAHNDAAVQLEVIVIPAAQLISDGNWWIEAVS